MSKNDIIAQKALQNAGQGGYDGTMENNRGVYPAIVVPYGTNDNSEQNRIRARIVSVGEDGKIQGSGTSGNEDNFNNYSGKDRGIVDGSLVLCIPFMTSFIHVKPQVGEMVFVIMENPTDSASVRYWIGPIITSKMKLKYQGYEDSVKIFNRTTFLSNQKTSGSIDLSSIFPEESDIAIHGRNDADLILKNREAFLVAGKFTDGQNFLPNKENPSFLKLKQVDSIAEATVAITAEKEIINNIYAYLIFNSLNNHYSSRIIITNVKSSAELKNEENSYLNKSDSLSWLNEKIKEAKTKYSNWAFFSDVLEYKEYPADYYIKPTPPATTPPAADNTVLLKKYSQGTLVSTNINIYSPRGKFRGDDLKNFEINDDLKSFGSVAATLHPTVFGDENIRVLDLIIRLLLTHIHTPEMPLLQTELSNELKKYTVEGLLQNLISNHIRIN